MKYLLFVVFFFYSCSDLEESYQEEKNVAHKEDILRADQTSNSKNDPLKIRNNYASDLIIFYQTSNGLIVNRKIPARSIGFIDLFDCQERVTLITPQNRLHDKSSPILSMPSDLFTKNLRLNNHDNYEVDLLINKTSHSKKKKDKDVAIGHDGIPPL